MHKKLIGIFLIVSSLYSYSASASPKNNFDSYWYWQSSVSPRYGVPSDFLKNYYAAIPPEFDINDPDKITRKFNNWSDIDNNYFIPKLVQEISTQGRRADTSNSKLGIERIVKAGHYLYTPALEADDNYNLDYALKDLGEYQVFDLNTLQHRTLEGPDLSTTGYELSLNSSPIYFSYNSFNFSLSPAGELAVRLFWLTDLSTKERKEGVVVWKPENGKVEKVIILPMNFQGDRAKNSCSFNHNNGEKGYPCIFEDQSNATPSQPFIIQAAPLNPFFTNESEVLLPVLFFEKTLTGDRKSYQQYVKFFFQPIQLTTNNQKWVFNLAKGYFHDVFKLDPDVPRHEVINFQKANGFSCLKSIDNSFPYMLAYNFNTKIRDCKLPTPTFSTQKIDNKDMIIASGEFYGNKTEPTALDSKNFYTNYWSHKYFLVDDRSETRNLLTTSASIPSFYPSIRPPYSLYNDTSYARLRPRDLSVENKDGSTSNIYGTELESVWSDPILQEGYYFTKLTSNVPFLNNDEKTHYRVTKIEPFTSVVAEEKLKSTWNSDALAIIEFIPKKQYLRTGEEECQLFLELKIKICNQIYYDATNPHQIISGNLFLENGEKLLIPEFSHLTSEGGTYWNPSYHSETIYKMTLPQTTDLEITIKVSSSRQCTRKANTVVCGDSSSSVEGKLTKDKIDYPIEKRIF